MSSLYAFETRRFQADEDSDEDDEGIDIFTDKKRKRKEKIKMGKPAPKVSSFKMTTVNILDDDDDNDDDNSPLEFHETAVVEKRKNASSIVDDLFAKSAPASSVEDKAKIPSDDEDEALKKAKEILKKAERLKTQMERPSANATSSQRHNDSELPKIFIPVIETAKERQSRVKIDLEIMNEPENSAGSVLEELSRLTLKTRLDGKHVWVWKVNHSIPFQKLKESFAEVYGIASIQSIVFKFDGEVLSANDTPKTTDMDEDNMIEVLIPKEEVAAAIARAEAYKSKGVVTPKVVEAPTLVVKTRLNGNHIWNWNITSSLSFGKLKSNFAVLYGIAASTVVMKFDGDALGDSATPASVDMEDGNMIDVTIPKAAYETAVASAEAIKTTTAASKASAVAGTTAAAAPFPSSAALGRSSGPHLAAPAAAASSQRVAIASSAQTPAAINSSSSSSMVGATPSASTSDSDGQLDLRVFVTAAAAATSSPGGVIKQLAVLPHQTLQTIYTSMLLPAVPMRHKPSFHQEEFPGGPPIAAALAMDVPISQLGVSSGSTLHVRPAPILINIEAKALPILPAHQLVMDAKKKTIPVKLHPDQALQTIFAYAALISGCGAETVQVKLGNKILSDPSLTIEASGLSDNCKIIVKRK